MWRVRVCKCGGGGCVSVEGEGVTVWRGRLCSVEREGV